MQSLLVALALASPLFAAVSPNQNASELNNTASRLELATPLLPLPITADSPPSAIPSQPRCLSVAQWTTNALLASWVDNAAHENVTHYQLGYLVPTERQVLVPAAFNASIIDNLEPGKTYVVALRACNAAGCSPNREKDIMLSRESDSLGNSATDQQCSPLPINELLQMPMEVRCQPLNATAVSLSWTDSGASLPIRLHAAAYYVVRHGPSTNRGPFETLSGLALRPSASDEALLTAAGGRRGRNELNSSSTAVVYGGLRPALSYEFAVSKVLLLLTQSRLKQSGWSMKIECSTREAAPTNAPTALTARQVDKHSVELKWQPCTQPNGLIVNHTVLVCREPGCSNVSPDNSAVWQPRNAALSDEFNGGFVLGVVDELESGASFRFRVRERNSVGESPPSDVSAILDMDPLFNPPSDETDLDDESAVNEYSTARNSDATGDDLLNLPSGLQGFVTPRDRDEKRRRSRKPASTTESSSTRSNGPAQEVWFAVVGAVTGAVTISIVIILVIVFRRRRNSNKRALRERAAKSDVVCEACPGGTVCCSRTLQRQGSAAAAQCTHGHPRSTLSVSLHGGLPSDASASALLFPNSAKSPPSTPRGTLRRFTLSSTLGTPLSAASCVPLLSSANLPGSPFSTGQPDDSRFDSPKFTDSLRYDPGSSQPSSPYRIGTLTNSTSAGPCGSPAGVGVGVELRSLSSTADSSGSTGNGDSATREQRASRGVPFVSPLHLPRTIGLLNALGASSAERTADLPALPPSQSLFGATAHPHAVLMANRMNDLSELHSPERERSRAPDMDMCTTGGTGSNSMASLSSNGFAQRAARGHAHTMVVDTTILSPLSKPLTLTRGATSSGSTVHEQQRQMSAARAGGAMTPLSVSSSGSGSGSGSANNSGSNCSANVTKTPAMARSTMSPACTLNTTGTTSTLGHGGTMMLSPASGVTIDPGYVSSTSMSLAPGGGAPSVDSGRASNPSRSIGTAHNRDDFQSYKSFSTDELSAETAHIEGFMKDLSSITQNDFC